MLKFWLCLLVGFFALAVDDPKDPPADDPADPQEDLDLGGVDDDPAPQGDPDPEPEDPKAALAAERTARAEAEARAEAHQRELTELRSQSRPAPASEDQKVFEQEEQRLKDPKTSDLERWQIESNRSLRAGKAASNAALFEARDVADRTSFRQLEVTKPALYKRYAVRVEEELAKARKAGNNAPREAILRFLIGNDALDGKLASKKKPAGAPAGDAIQRGKLPGAKADVRGKGVPMTNREKLRAKLDGVQI